MQTTTTTTTAHLPTAQQLGLNSEAYNYANAANRIAADAAQQLKHARKTYTLTPDDDLALAYYAKGARAMAAKACEHASRARANTPGTPLHHHNTQRAAELAQECENYATRLCNHLAEIEMANDDGTGW